MDCPECGGLRLSEENGQLTCLSCGLVIGEVIDTGPERRAYGFEDYLAKSRTNPLNASSSTTIGRVGEWVRDSSNHRLTAEKALQVFKWRRWQARSLKARYGLIKARRYAETVAFLMGLPENLKDEALNLYVKALRARLTTGRSMKSLVAACLYAACRAHNLPRTVKEVAEHAGERRSDVASYYRMMLKRGLLTVPPPSMEAYVAKIASILQLSGAVQLEAIRILEEARRKGLTASRSPVSLAAGALYTASLTLKEYRTQLEIAKAAGVTEVTVRNIHYALSRLPSVSARFKQKS